MSRADGMVEIESFTAELAVGDVLLLTSRRLPLADEDVAGWLRRLHDVRTPLADVVDELAQAVRNALSDYHDVAFAVVRRIG